MWLCCKTCPSCTCELRKLEPIPRLFAPVRCCIQFGQSAPGGWSRGYCSSCAYPLCWFVLQTIHSTSFQCMCRLEQAATAGNCAERNPEAALHCPHGIRQVSSRSPTQSLAFISSSHIPPLTTACLVAPRGTIPPPPPLPPAPFPLRALHDSDVAMHRRHRLYRLRVLCHLTWPSLQTAIASFTQLIKHQSLCFPQPWSAPPKPLFPAAYEYIWHSARFKQQLLCP